MTVYQLLYDASIYFISHSCSATSGQKVCTSIFTFGFIFGGCGAALFSLMLVLGAAFTVEYKRKPTRREELAALVVSHALLVGYGIPAAHIGCVFS
jgi:hypothetical protein